DRVVRDCRSHEFGFGPNPLGVLNKFILARCPVFGVEEYASDLVGSGAIILAVIGRIEADRIPAGQRDIQDGMR
ncbi:hypothetical protein, partial [Enterobacter asburiae]|uniref:hypothetical protein n=1 Tax=Enterobacter asburiae TaxID=61645 RepID=UPI0013D40B00